MEKSSRIVVNWVHLALLMVPAGVMAAYLLDARGTSLRINNLLFVQPAALVGLALSRDGGVVRRGDLRLPRGGHVAVRRTQLAGEPGVQRPVHGGADPRLWRDHSLSLAADDPLR